MSKWNKSINCIGDSLTYNTTLGVKPEEFWVAKLQSKLEKLGCSVVCRNFGISGNTTTQMVSRFDNMTIFGVPEIGIIFGGTNDPANSINKATTQANLQSMIQSLKSSGCTKIIVVSELYMNFTTGGDTLSTPYANYVLVREAQSAAAQAESVVFSDLYTYLRNRIVNGLEKQGSYSWHVADGNQHFNAYGEELVANCILATIQSQDWVTDLM